MLNEIMLQILSTHNPLKKSDLKQASYRWSTYSLALCLQEKVGSNGGQTESKKHEPFHSEKQELLAGLSIITLTYAI